MLSRSSVMSGLQKILDIARCSLKNYEVKIAGL